MTQTTVPLSHAPALEKWLSPKHTQPTGTSSSA